MGFKLHISRHNIGSIIDPGHLVPTASKTVSAIAHGKLTSTAIWDPGQVGGVLRDISKGNFASSKARPIDYMAIGPLAKSKRARGVGRAAAIVFGGAAAAGALSAGGASAGVGAGTTVGASSAEDITALTSTGFGGGATAGGTAASTSIWGTVLSGAKSVIGAALSIFGAHPSPGGFADTITAAPINPVTPADAGAYATDYPAESSLSSQTNILPVVLIVGAIILLAFFLKRK